MRPNLRLQLRFSDRVGIVSDIAVLLAEKGLNILTMEVVKDRTYALVYVEIEMAADSPERRDVMDALGRISGLIEIGLIHVLPQEERERRFRVVLDNISDGVIAVDNQGKIAVMNRMARRILNCTEEEGIGKDIKEMNLPDYSILECLNGKKFSNLKKNLINEKGRFSYFATGRPICNGSGAIVGAVEIGRDMKEIRRLAKSISEPPQITFSDIIGKSASLREAISFAQRIAGADAIVSMRGESGTGKEVFARAIHSGSGRAGPFIPINCAALPEPLLESELFGYSAGAFTGAKKEGKGGLFEKAGDGTLFLDEIGEMPCGAQAKILRVIQERCVRRIGGNREIPIRCRVITATNQNLENRVKENAFREDLYYRINVLPIHIPPLRERTEDIPLLADHFLFKVAARLGKDVPSISIEGLNKMYRHRWPGNVRELKNVTDRAAILCDSDVIQPEHILFSHEIEGGLQKIPAENPNSRGASGTTLPAMLDLHERGIIAETLKTADSIRKAARILGVSHTTLLNKLKKHNLKMERN